MSKTHHHGKYGLPVPEKAKKKRAAGYEYWGRDGYMGESRWKTVRRRRNRDKQIVREEIRNE